MKKIRSNNDVINRIGLVYAKTEIELLEPTDRCDIFMKTR